MTVKERVYLKLQREFFLNSFQMDVPRMHAFVRTLRHERPRYIKGYAGSLATFARFLDANAIDVPPAVAIRSSAEVLRPQDRALIEKRFQAPVYDFYGSREVNNLAAECEQRSGLHVLAWGRIVELVDRAGRPVPEAAG
ncbi:MAG: hypothetical protein HC882_02275 [Acidobacteria bacterium]|nr:hypothetical protein [Acidobacteriota bacterium]